MATSHLHKHSENMQNICIFHTYRRVDAVLHFLLCDWCYIPNTPGLNESWAFTEISAPWMPVKNWPIMLTCEINTPTSYIVTRETTSAVHLKASKSQVLCSSVSIKCWITFDWVLEPSPAWQQNGQNGVAGRSCKLGSKRRWFCGTKSFPFGTKTGRAMQLWLFKLPKRTKTMESFRNLVL